MPAKRGLPAPAHLRRISTLITDCDGVLTNGALYYSHDNQRHLVFDSHDGYGLAVLGSHGYGLGVISGRSADIAQLRLAELGFTHFYGKSRDKRSCLMRMAAEMNVPLEEVAYVGDDLVDLPAFEVAGLAICVADGHALLKQQAHWVTLAPGGQGAIREVCEALLRARGLAPLPKSAS